jgi:NAD(P)-dependent dehydrogenase (short-subunit alcohol dehydrogenase family)
MLTTLGLTKTVALEATGHGITVHAICTGYVLASRSEFQEGQGAEHNREASRVRCSTLNHAEVCDNARDRPGLVPAQHCGRFRPINTSCRHRVASCSVRTRTEWRYSDSDPGGWI